jgi:hypothetical protein
MYKTFERMLCAAETRLRLEVGRRYQRIITPPERYALLAQTEYMDFATCIEYATYIPGFL